MATSTSTNVTSNYIATINSGDTYTGNSITTGTTPFATYDSYTVNLPPSICIDGESAESYVHRIVDDFLNPKNKNDKENKTMKFGKFNFGPITDGSVVMSMYGLAVKNTSGEYVCYDDQKEEVIDVTGLTFDQNNMIYAIPTAIKDIACGDMIIHNKHYCYIVDGDDTSLSVIDISDGTVKDILPTKSPFGFNFVTKVISLMNMGKASADSPFGDNFLTMMLLMNGNIDNKMLPFLMMQKDNKMDPMMLALLLK